MKADTVAHDFGRNHKTFEHLDKPENCQHQQRVKPIFELHCGQNHRRDDGEDRAEVGNDAEDPGENPSLPALKELYARTRGGADGFDPWLEKATDSDRARRRQAILAARLEEPQPIPDFALRTLDGGGMSSDDVKGKIVVVNFWGMWCGWCMEEMPDVQKLHERYRGDPQVRVLTIDNDQNTDAVRDWMREKKYNFPVLLDEGYASQAGITGFPHTWFLDRDGRRAFEQPGWSKYLVEEFGWRIEALRDGAGGGE